MKRVPGGLARRYARALLEVAEAGGKDKALALKQELRAFARELEAHAPLRRALEHPSLAAEKKRNIVAALAERAQATALESALKSRGSSVELASVVDPALLGGLVLRLGGRTYDGSVRTRLAALKRRLATSG